MAIKNLITFWLLIALCWVAIGFSIPVDGLPGAGLAILGIVLAWAAYRVQRKRSAR